VSSWASPWALTEISLHRKPYFERVSPKPMKDITRQNNQISSKKHIAKKRLHCTVSDKRTHYCESTIALFFAFMTLEKYRFERTKI